ncbi:MAG: hypothetical protein R3B41_01905 [Candidatus Doudnabacteria bacterium]
MNNLQDPQSDFVTKLQAKHLAMKPKWYFFVRQVIKAGLVGVFATSAMYFVSLIIFTLYSSGAIHLSRFGLMGLSDLLLSLPWLIIALALVSVFGLVWISDKYPITYRHPLVFTFIFVVGVVTLGSYAIGQTRLHDTLAVLSSKSFGFSFSPYPQAEMIKLHNAEVGEVVEVDDDGFWMANRAHDEVYVEISEQTQFAPKDAEIENDDIVIVSGSENDKKIRAKGIKVLREGDSPLMMPGGSKKGHSKSQDDR